MTVSNRGDFSLSGDEVKTNIGWYNSWFGSPCVAGRWSEDADARKDPVSVTKNDKRPGTKSADFEKRSRQMIDRLTEIKNEEERIRQCGGAKAIEAQHKKGRLTARERIAKLIDPETDFFELGLYAAYEMYEEWGGAPAAGTITGLAQVSGRRVMIIANDATVKAGAFFPMTAKKVIRAQNIAIEKDRKSVV